MGISKAPLRGCVCLSCQKARRDGLSDNEPRPGQFVTLADGTVRPVVTPANPPPARETERRDTIPVPAGHPGYLKLLDEMRELHCKKAADYGRGVDPFANVRAGAEFGVPAWVGVMIRANDKLHRIKSYVANGSLKNESVEDSLLDLAAYSLIALTLLREEQGT